MISENGPDLGSFISAKEYINQSGSALNLRSIRGTKVLLFISMHCVRCMELVPELQQMHLPHARFILFSTGSDEDHKELDEFLQRKWPIVSLSPEQMEEDFLIRSHPFGLVIDENQQVCNKGTVYTSNELLELAGTRGAGNLLKVLRNYVRRK
ncbi:hypothetical protein DFP94_105147 [Fontibacillus phaseoli]|uniref:AhpC/TSA family protein n=1 Tax=Fontibacillus phaseoli TaxID=1416533 RepID=A0A369BCJ5_9BACL|nr:hypothetical protein [Fontibacillus phaseoli]RCX19131.1 hypothetical protein DFP94_105147 [Fontibacillus phaseoli]